MKTKSESSPARVCFAITAFEVGGAENQIRRLIAAFQQRGVEVALVILNARTVHVDELDRRGVKTIALNLHQGGLVAALPRMVRFLRATKSKVLMCFLPHACLLGRAAAPLSGVKFVVNSHRSTVLTHGWLLSALKLTSRLNNRWVGNSKGVRDFLIQTRLADPDRSSVIYNGIDVKLYQPCSERRVAMRDSLGLADEEFVWIAVGRLHVSKDYPTLLNAFRQVKAAEPDTKLLIVGEGSLREDLTDQIQKLGLSNSVFLLRHRPDVVDLLQAADGFVMASIYEGMSNALLEAVVSGLPVACTRVGGVEEILPPGYESSIVEPGDGDGLAAAMLRLQSMDDEQFSETSQTFRSFAESRFGIEAVADQWLDLVAINS